MVNWPDLLSVSVTMSSSSPVVLPGQTELLAVVLLSMIQSRISKVLLFKNLTTEIISKNIYPEFCFVVIFSFLIALTHLSEMH